MDLFSDLLPMLNHSKPLVRKKAVLVMYKVFLQYPDALRVVFPRLAEKLEDEDIGINLFPKRLIPSRGLCHCERNMWTSEEESKELSRFGSSIVQSIDNIK